MVPALAGRMHISPPRLFYVLAMTSALVVGALQTFHVRAGWLTNYGADVFGTAWLYAMFRQGRTIFRRGRTMTAGAAAAFIFFGCAVSEFAQAAGFLPGVFDPFDLVAFLCTSAACYTLDRAFDLGVEG